ncbi:MAG TPA: hypothetical protein VGO32_03955 [Candidatus Limnocylindria bacterium]|jgi:hypothetical protein|nr:hypothetical protein [Candidatus Limnocylindria bacterium]
MTSYALPRRRGLLARLIGEADDFTTWLLFGSETWLIAAMKAVPLFLFIYWLFTYVPNSVYYGVTQYIPFLQFSAEVGFIVANVVAGTNVLLVVVLAFVVQASRGRQGPGWTLLRLFVLANYVAVVLLLIPYFVFNVAGGSFIPLELPLIALALGAMTAGMGVLALGYLYYEFRRISRREAQAAAALSVRAG